MTTPINYIAPAITVTMIRTQQMLCLSTRQIQVDKIPTENLDGE